MWKGPLFLAMLSLLGLAVAMASFGQGGPDTDGDGVPDASDNCILVQNGPLFPFGDSCDQPDADLDGYGNACDTDLNNDLGTGLDDVAAFFEAAFVVSTDPIYDTNCDGAVGLDDLAGVWEDSKNVDPPGPSGLACAGAPPCPL